MALIKSLLQNLHVKTTTWQILSKHLPARTESYEPTELALALTCQHGIVVLASNGTEAAEEIPV